MTTPKRLPSLRLENETQSCGELWRICSGVLQHPLINPKEATMAPGNHRLTGRSPNVVAMLCRPDWQPTSGTGIRKILGVARL